MRARGPVLAVGICLCRRAESKGPSGMEPTGPALGPVGLTARSLLCNARACMSYLCKMKRIAA